MSENKKQNNYVAVGGQALMEGIMMRGPKGTAMSLRLPDGSIETEMKEFTSLRKKYAFFRVPVIRGIVSFIESMVMGYGLIMESAEKTTDMTESEQDSKLDKWITEHFGPKMMAVLGTVATVLGILLSFVLFIWLPSFIFDIFNNHVFDGKIQAIRPLFEGIIRIIIFVSYMFITAQMKEIKRVYMYHGAEHKTIFCFEHGKELTVENIKEEKRFHPRCGTSFIFVTIILSILISSLVAVIFPALTKTRAIWICVKLLLLPLIMGVGFEFIQLAGKYPNKFTRVLSAPGLAMQRITTSEPDDPIIEVAIAAMKAALSGKPEADNEAESAIEEKESAPGADSATFMNLPSDYIDSSAEDEESADDIQ